MELIDPPPVTIENVNGLVPPAPENVNVLFTAKVFDAGEMLIGVVTITLALAVFPKLSVTCNVTEAFVAGAVYEPVTALIEPPPETIEYVYGETPFAPVKDVTELAITVCDAGEIVNAELIVTVEFEIFPRLSVTRSTTDPAVAGAV